MAKETAKKVEQKEQEREPITSIEIAGKSYDIHIGFAFIRELDKRHPEAGVGAYGVGITSLMFMMEQRNPLGLLDFIQCATVTAKQKPAVADIEKEIEAWYEAGELEDYYENFMHRLATSGMTAPTVELFLKETRG